MDWIKDKTYDEVLRFFGNICIVAGYFLVVNNQLVLGCSIRILGTFLILPYIHKNKLWDFAVVMGIFTSIDIHAITTEIL